MIQPLEMKPRWVMAACGLSALGMLAGAVALLVAHGDLLAAGVSLDLVQVALYVSMLLTLAGFLGWLCFGVWRGPPREAPRVIVGDEGGVLLFAALGALLFDAIAVRMLIDLRDGDAESAVLPTAFVLLGAFFTLAFLGQVWRLAWRGRSRVTLDDGPILMGDSFTGSLDLPFAVGRAPPVRATLSLMRNDIRSSDIEGSQSESALWSEAMEIRCWVGSASRRCVGHFQFELPESLPGGACLSGGGLHTWRLAVESLTEGRPFSSDYLLPIAIYDPVDERIIAEA